MLYEETTTGAVVAGHKISTGGELTGAQAQEIESAVDALNEKYGQNIRLFVPGDSATDNAMNPDSELYAYDVIFGVAALLADPWDCPAPVAPERVESSMKMVRETPDEYWEELAQKVPIMADFTPDDPKTYLTSFGPLPYACLAAGVPVSKDERDNTTYDFFSVQDMYQEWQDQGVDGVRIQCVEFTSVYEVDLSADAIDEWLAKADQLDDPKIYMTVRYD